MTEPVRVIMVAACPFPANHGTPAAIRALALQLVQQGCEVHVLTYPQQDEEVPVEGLVVHRVAALPGVDKMIIGPSWRRLVYDFLMIFKLFRIVRQYRIQIIHAHNYEATLAAAPTRFLTGKPLLYTGVNTMADELPSYDFIKPKKLAYGLGKVLDYVVPRLGHAVMALSDELRQDLKHLGIEEQRIVVIPPGVEEGVFESGQADSIRQQYSLQNKRVVMYTGALETFQGIEYLLEAMVQVARACDDVCLLVVVNIDNDRALQKYQAMAVQLGIEHCTRFVGPVAFARLPDYLAAADVAVLPRPSCPGYPIKLLNYMAAAKAIVTFRGSAKAILHGYSGYIADDYDSRQLAEGIVRLLNDDGLRQRLGQNARKSLQGVFDWPTLARGTLILYHQLLLDNRAINKKALAPYIRKSYTPYLPDRTKPEDGFLYSGPVEYPSF